ncbi:MAG TPA: RHS repeat-associated core domain-containing protein [Marmoricola sp.]|nr:RHS repeat-associated core domain-containing protein [Marmoricola sp.]
MRTSLLKKTVVLTCLTLTASGLGAVTSAASARPLTKAPDVQVEPSIGGKDFVPRVRARTDAAMASSKNYQVHGSLPAATGQLQMTLPAGTSALARVPGTPVAVGRARAEHPASLTAPVPDLNSATVEVLGQRAARAVGVHGFLFRLALNGTGAPAAAATGTTPSVVTPTPTASTTPGPASTPSSSPAATPSSGVLSRQQQSVETAAVPVSVDYSTFADAYGGDYASRLKLVAVPECALETPRPADCPAPTPLPTTRDTKTKTLQATAPVQMTSQKSATSTSSGAMLLAATSTASGDEGDFASTSLAPASEWAVGTQTGDFSWSYPIPTVPVPGGLAPDLSVSYSSQSIDGRTQASNNQTSWLGEGQSLEPGFIERSYAACADSQPVGEKTGDLCWKSANQNATLSFQGQSTQLVKDTTTGEWRAKDDQGWRIRKLSGDPNGDNNGEYWELTDQDGTRYYFGKEKRFDTDTADTNSAWTVPVYGDDPGEPCHASTFGQSRCAQVWRWNLDYVVDVHDNTISYFYNEETNRYGANNDSAQPSYVRGGYLTRIDYGTVVGQENSVAPAARVAFTVAERCLPTSDFDCDPSKLNDANASYWPDVPSDQICDSQTTCSNTSPAFFSRKRLVAITPQVLTSTGYADVDRIDLTQSFPLAGDGSGRSLFLNSLQRTGLNGANTAVPPVTFAATLMENRVPTLNTAPLSKWRVTGITTESGGVITVNYSAKDCTPDDLPADESTNTRRCFPVYWDLNGDGTPDKNWFQKYVVDSISEADHGGTVTAIPTYYTYLGGGAWHYDNNELVKKKYRTWGQWRGYNEVEVRQGDPTETGTSQSYDKYLYLRGMDGDHLPDGSTRSVTVTDGLGGTITDADRFNGFKREHIQKSGATIVSAEINDPWSSGVTADDGTDRAYIVRTGATHVRRQLVGTGNFVSSTTSTDYDADGLPTAVHDDGNDIDPGGVPDSTCTRTQYAQNRAAWILTPVQKEWTVNVGCSVTAATSDILASKQYSFDGQAYGAAPTKGDVTTEQTMQGSASGVWAMNVTKSSTYDARGRVVSTTDALGNTSSVAYTPAGTSGSTLGPVTKTTSTNALGQTTSTTFDPARGQPLSYTDLNGRVTSATYDGLGRRTAVWRPGRTQGTDSPDLKFGYSISASTYSYVSTDRLLRDGTYAHSYGIFDANLRTVETQAESAGATAGRVITTSYYNSRGQKVQDVGPFTVNSSAPSGTYYDPTVVQVMNNHRHLYDGAGRQIAEIYQPKNDESNGGWRTTTAYDADKVSVDPPTGGTPTTTVTDVRGNTTQRVEYLSTGLNGTTQTTTYRYDLANRMTSMTDPAGNAWSWTYDLSGNQVTATDPDAGTTTTNYNAGNQPTTVTTANGSLFTTYDALGRRTALYNGTSADTTKLRAAWTYDQARNGTAVPNGIGELTSTTRLAGVGGSGAPQYTEDVTGYEIHGQPTGTTTTIPSIAGETNGPSGASTDTVAGTYTTTMTYLTDGSLSSKKLPTAPGFTAETLRYFYGRLGQPNSMGGTESLVNATTYSPYGELLQTTTGTTSGKMSYNTWYLDEGTRRLTRNIVSDQAVTGSITDANYTYDQAGNVLGIADNAGTKDLQCFTYDYQRQLTNAWTNASGACGTPSQAAMSTTAGSYWSSYAYDAIGNRTSQTSYLPSGSPTITTYGYPASGSASTLDGTSGGPHAVSSVVSKVGSTTTATTSYQYDPAGQMRTRGGQTLTWDPEGKLATAVNSAGAPAAKNVYDADGNRLLRKDPDGTIRLYLDSTEITLKSGTATSQRWYTFAGRIVATRTAAGLQLLSTDAQGTGQVQISAFNAAYTKRRFDPFGNARTGTSSPSGTAWTGDHGFLDKPVDQSGLTQVGARYYDAAVGKFVSPDPVLDTSNPIQTNAYAYAGNNPTTFTDPTGLSYNPDGPQPACNPNTQNCGAKGDGSSNGYSQNPKPIGSTAPPAHHLSPEAQAAVKEFQDGGPVVSALIKPDLPTQQYLASIGYSQADYMLLTLTNSTLPVAEALDGFTRMELAILGVDPQAPVSMQSVVGLGSWLLPELKVAAAARTAEVVKAERAAVAANTTARGWKVGDPIENLTKAGNSPAWSTVRARYWKNAANDALEGEYSAANLARMRAGKPPLHDELGVPMELNHIIPRYQGGGHTLDNLEPLWPWEHAAVDPYRFYTGPTP